MGYFKEVLPKNQLFYLLRRVNKFTAVGVYLSEGRHPIIPLFHYSITPTNCERSEGSSILSF
jgi:hypothetical protein